MSPLSAEGTPTQMSLSEETAVPEGNSPRQRRESDWTSKMRQELEDEHAAKRNKVHKSEHLFQHELYDEGECGIINYHI